MKATQITLLFSSLLFFGCKEIQNDNINTIKNDRFEHVRNLINDKIEKKEIPSLSVAVAEKGKIIWMESFGWADMGNKIKATPNTLYSIASITKPLISTGIMKLYEQGKIDLDENVDRYINPVKLKYYTNDSIKVTCRHLLSHTSGLPLHFNYYYDDDTATIPPIEQVIERYGIIINQPSTRYVYSNLGDGILGYIISKISHTDLESYMKVEVFKPLGMTKTTLNISFKTKQNLAKRYDWKGNLLPFSFSDTPGAGNVNSTINDLIKFGMFHLKDNLMNQKKIISDSTISLMHNQQYPDNLNGRNSYGLGWFIDDKNYKYKILYHAGGMDGVGGMIKLIPSKDIAVVAIMNCYGEFTGQICDSVLTELIPDLKETNLKEIKSDENSHLIVTRKELIGTWEGNIVTLTEKIPIKLTFQSDGDIHVDTKAQFESINLMTNIYSLQHKMLLNEIFWSNGHLVGWYAEKIPEEDYSRCPHTTLLDLEYQSGKLRGTAVALASSNRMYYGLSNYLELEKK